MARILIVHDDEETRFSIRKAAHNAGFDDQDMVVKETYEAALQWLAEPFELVELAVIDINLRHGYDNLGVELVRELRPRQPNCKIIVVTQQSLTDPFCAALNLGANDFISENWEKVNFVELLTHKLVVWKRAGEFAAHLRAAAEPMSAAPVGAAGHP